MTWSHDPPNRPGFHWVKRPRSRCIEVVEVYATTTGPEPLLIAMQLHPNAYALRDINSHGIIEWRYPALVAPAP